jgi:hypothetical protein
MGREPVLPQQAGVSSYGDSTRSVAENLFAEKINQNVLGSTLNRF